MPILYSFLRLYWSGCCYGGYTLGVRHSNAFDTGVVHPLPGLHHFGEKAKILLMCSQSDGRKNDELGVSRSRRLGRLEISPWANHLETTPTPSTFAEVLLLISMGACASSPCNPLHRTATYTLADDKVMQLISAERCSERCADGRYALHYAAASGCASASICAAILDAYPEAVRTPDRDGHLPAHAAAQSCGSVAVAEKILSAYPEAVHKKTMARSCAAARLRSASHSHREHIPLRSSARRHLTGRGHTIRVTRLSNASHVNSASMWRHTVTPAMLHSQVKAIFEAVAAELPPPPSRQPTTDRTRRSSRSAARSGSSRSVHFSAAVAVAV